MRGSTLAIIALPLTFLRAPVAQPAEDVGSLMRELKGETPAVSRTPGQWREAHAKALAAFLSDMAGKDVKVQEQAQRTWQTICWRAGRPGAEAERASLCGAMAEALGKPVGKPAKLWLLKQLEYIGRGEAVEALAGMIANPDALLRESGRRALVRNPDPVAAAKLREALAAAQDPAWTVALINALAARRDSGSLPLLAERLAAANSDVARAAAHGLGRIGGSQAADALAKATGDPTVQRAVCNAIFTCADDMLAGGRREEAARIYERIYTASGPLHVRIAALQGLLAAREAKAVPLIMKVLSDGAPALQAAATRFIRELPNADTTKALAAALPKFAPAGQALLLDALADRGDPAARPAAVAATASPEPQVRTAALRALAQLGDGSTVPLLAKAAAEKGPAADAARTSLRRLHAQGVDPAIIAASRQGPTPVRVELIRCMIDRRCTGAVPALVDMARDPSQPVRLESLKALDVLAGEAALPSLVEWVLRSPKGREREAAVKATASTCRRVDKPRRGVAPILAAMAGAEGEARGALLSILGRVGGPQALAAVRADLSDKRSDVHDAALRAMAGWPDAAALGGLLTIARDTDDPVHNVLALRGCVRLAGLPSGRPPSETVEFYRQTMAAARRPEERKLVLAAVGKVGDLAALDLARSCLSDDAIKAEAAIAMLQVAERTSYPHRQQAEATVSEVIAQCQDPSVRTRAAATRQRLAMYDDSIRSWLVSPAYTRSRKRKKGLFHAVLPPEDPEAKDVKWQCAIGDPDPRKSWSVDLGHLLGGSSRVAYVLAWVRSAEAQEARLELGSDDGVKAWLNREVVHTNDTHRPLKFAQDKAAVSLRQGWNRLMLKVTQSGGDWAACARLCAKDGKPLSGLTRLDDLRQLDALTADAARPNADSDALSAWVAITNALVESHPDAAKRAFRALLAASKDKELAARARKGLEDITRYEDYITTWQFAGPYTKGSTSGHELFDVPFAPETDDAAKVQWRPVPTDVAGRRGWMVNLGREVGGHNRVGYLRAFAFAPKAQPAMLELGSDDGVIAWLNGRVVHANSRPRPVRAGEDRARVTLEKGWNSLVLKICQGAGGWGACARFRELGDASIPGLKTHADLPKGWQAKRLQPRPQIGEDDPFVGEYKGTFTPAKGPGAAAQAKVVPRAGLGYLVVLLTGEPGQRIELMGQYDGEQIAFAGEAGRVEWQGSIKAKRLAATSAAGRFGLEFTVRRSPTEGQKPPADAVVLLPFTPGHKPSLDAWTNATWEPLPDGRVRVGKGTTRTKREFGDCRIHLEFRTPYERDRLGQARGNSGVYVQTRFEVQVLDSFGLVSTYQDCGAIYKVSPPLVNACLPQLAWQTYDITFQAARMSPDNKTLQRARITVLHNGIKIQDAVELPEWKHGKAKDGIQQGSLLLQDHHNPVQYRNIWLVEALGKPEK